MDVRVLIVDDLEPFRSAARAVVQATPGFQVAGEVATGEASVDEVQGLRPDLVLMDVNLPGIGGVEATRRIRVDAPKAVVVLLSTRAASEVGSLAEDCGAAAYIAKSAFSPETLAAAWATALEQGHATEAPGATPHRPDRPLTPAGRAADLGPEGADRSATSPDAIVEARRLRKVYQGAGQVEALRGVDLEVRRGEMLALVGPSGSGKTTLLNCLSGLDRFDAGTVIVDGTDLAEMSDRQRTAYRCRNMGFVFQAFNLLPVLTAVENVEIPLLLTGVGGREAHRTALDMLETLGLAHRAKHRPDQLSGGEQQRVAVARALVHRPAVVWADEPTGNLDTEVSQVIVELLLRMNADGQTIVLVTHNPQVAERAGRVLHMRDGRIEAAVAPARARTSA
jgi:putative ABC transport system ATP-binding protein